MDCLYPKGSDSVTVERERKKERKRILRPEDWAKYGMEPRIDKHTHNISYIYKRKLEAAYLKQKIAALEKTRTKHKALTKHRARLALLKSKKRVKFVHATKYSFMGEIEAPDMDDVESESESDEEMEASDDGIYDEDHNMDDDPPRPPPYPSAPQQLLIEDIAAFIKAQSPSVLSALAAAIDPVTAAPVDPHTSELQRPPQPLSFEDNSDHYSGVDDFDSNEATSSSAENPTGSNVHGAQEFNPNYFLSAEGVDDLLTTSLFFKNESQDDISPALAPSDPVDKEAMEDINASPANPLAEFAAQDIDSFDRPSHAVLRRPSQSVPAASPVPSTTSEEIQAASNPIPEDASAPLGGSTVDPNLQEEIEEEGEEPGPSAKKEDERAEVDMMEELTRLKNAMIPALIKFTTQPDEKEKDPLRSPHFTNDMNAGIVRMKMYGEEMSNVSQHCFRCGMKWEARHQCQLDELLKAGKLIGTMTETNGDHRTFKAFSLDGSSLPHMERALLELNALAEGHVGTHEVALPSAKALQVLVLVEEKEGDSGPEEFLSGTLAHGQLDRSSPFRPKEGPFQVQINMNNAAMLKDTGKCNFKEHREETKIKAPKRPRNLPSSQAPVRQSKRIKYMAQ